MKPVRFLGLTLGLWAVGVQLNELLAVLGAWSCAVVVVVHLRRAGPAFDWKSWWPVWAFVGWSLAAPALAGAWPTGTGVARLADWLLVPVACAAVSLATPLQRRRVAVVATAVLLVSCAVAGLQHFGVWPEQASFSALAWSKIPFERVYEPIAGAEGRFMAGGLLFHRLRFANISSLLVVMLVAFGVQTTGGARRAALGAAAAAFAAVAFFPYARSATVALAVGVGLVMVLGARRKLAATAALGALATLVLGLVALTPSLKARFLDAATAQGSGERPGLIAAGLSAVRAHPLVGVGAGRFRPSLFAAADAPAQVREHPGKSHNQFVTLAAESGVPGALLFMVLLAVLGARLWKGRPASLGAFGALVVLVLVCLTHDPLFHAEMSMATVLVLGAGLGLAAQAGRLSGESLR